MAISKEKKAALTSVLKGLNKKFGDKVNFVDDIQEQLKIKRYKTPSLELNIALNGGIPIGKIVELYGQPSCGKTSLAMEIINNIDILIRNLDIKEKDKENYNLILTGLNILKQFNV